jgi:hypothetical protein
MIIIMEIMRTITTVTITIMIRPTSRHIRRASESETFQ